MHCVIFITYESSSIGQNCGTTWSIKASCPVCCCELDGERLITALTRIYSDAVAEKIYQAFEYKKKYLSLATELSHMGITKIHGLIETNESADE